MSEQIKRKQFAMTDPVSQLHQYFLIISYLWLIPFLLEFFNKFRFLAAWWDLYFVMAHLINSNLFKFSQMSEMEEWFFFFNWNGHKNSWFRTHYKLLKLIFGLKKWSRKTYFEISGAPSELLSMTHLFQIRYNFLQGGGIYPRSHP